MLKFTKHIRKFPFKPLNLHSITIDMRQFLILILICCFIMACNKDTFETRPTIKIKEVNSEVIPENGNLDITLEYTDKEGDLGRGELTYIRERKNIKPIPNPGVNDQIDTVHYPIPDYTPKNKGEIVVTIPYSLMSEDPNDDDTMIFKLSVIDIRGNKSDTVTTVNIIAKQN